MLVFMGWLNGWFSSVGFSVQASKPAKTSADYQVRGEERIKNPFTWDDGVEDIRTAIRLEKDKQYISNQYHALASAYMIKRDKAKALEHLTTALKFSKLAEAEAKNDIDRNAAKASAELDIIFLKRCIKTDCTHW